MPSLGLTGLIFSAYFVAGRFGAVATCLLSGIAPWQAFSFVFLIDFLQIPVYGLLLERMKVSDRIRNWVAGRWEKVRNRLAHNWVMNRITDYQPLTVILVSSLPLRGFGVLSASVLAHMLKQRRIMGTLYIMTGSGISTVLFILIFYLPARWINAM